MRLPKQLSEAIELELKGINSKELTKASEELTSRYRAADRDESSVFMSSDAHRASYIVARMPATYIAVKRVLSEVKDRLPDVAIASLLDLGCGPGTVMWAASEMFEELKEVQLIELDDALMGIGRRLAEKSDHTSVSSAQWKKADLSSDFEIQPADLITASYALGELSEEVIKKVVRKAWDEAKVGVVIIEPGTPRGFNHILLVRDELIKLGAHIVAPCPHALECSMLRDSHRGDWCHFSARVERTISHKRIKSGTLSYEDEKFSYIVASKIPSEKFDGRIIRHPQNRTGHIHLELCVEEGIKRETVSKRNKEAFSRARKAEWGDAWSAGALARTKVFEDASNS